MKHGFHKKINLKIVSKGVQSEDNKKMKLEFL